MKVEFKKIIIFLWIIWVFIFWLFLFNINNDTANISATQDEIEKFNTIIFQASHKSDIDNCDKIWNLELEWLCKSQLENRFSPLYWADNISICKSDKDVLKQDMCILEVAYSQSKNINDTWLCNEIWNQDIKDACFAQIMNKKF